MRIEFKTEGGIAYFPGLSKPTVVDTDDLDDAEAERLQRLVASIGFFALPPEASTPRPGAADYQSHTVSIEDGGRHHRVRFADPIGDPEQQALVDALTEFASTRRSAERRDSADGG